MLPIAICMATSSCLDNNNFRPGISVYEDRENSRRDSNTSLVVDYGAGLLLEYDKTTVDYSVRQETEIGDLFKPKFNGQFFFDEATRILVPKSMNARQWKAFGHTCKSEPQRGLNSDASYTIHCYSLDRPDWSSSFTYDGKRGVTSLFRPCPAFKPKVGCKLTLVTEDGIFSDKMRAIISESR